MNHFRTHMPRALLAGAMLVLMPLAFVACAATPAQNSVVTRCECGVVESVTPRTVQGGNTTGATIAGAIIGGIVGHQFGGGSGKSVTTAAGAVGGAAAGNKIASGQTHQVYDMAIRMDNGGMRYVTVNSAEGLAPGDRVDIRDGRVAHF